MNTQENIKEKISPVRISQWIVDRYISDTNTPMQSLLHSSNLSPEQLERIYKINLLSLKMQSKVRNITELYGEDDGVSLIQQSSYNAKNFLEAVLHQVNMLFRENGVMTELICDDSCSNIRFDSRRLKIILCNLFSNAVIHTDNKNKIITIRAFMRVNDFVIDVTDNGKCIPHKNRAGLFDIKETKISPTSADILALGGLGLPVCRKLAKDMGGNVIYVPSSGYNRFEVSIPQDTSAKYIGDIVSYISDFEETKMYMADALLHLLG